MTATRFAPVVNPFTREEVVRFVPIPHIHTKKKGTTQHDDKFDKLMDFKQAMVIPEHEFGGVRKALQRYLDNKGLRQKVSMRQFKNPRTKSFTIWVADVPPQVRIPKGKK
jgi:hypothetical protein